MDGDLQNDPADIGAALRKIDEGYDIVVGWRFDRQDKLWYHAKFPSRIANALIAKVTGVPIKDNGCSLKAYRASLIKKIPLYSEMHRFIPAMASIAGPQIAEIKVRHHARQFGQSKYGLSRIYKVLLDLMVIKTVASFTARPMLWFGMLSIPMLLVRRRSRLAGHVLCNFASRRERSSLPIAGMRRDLPQLGHHPDGQRCAGRARLQARRHARARVLRASRNRSGSAPSSFSEPLHDESPLLTTTVLPLSVIMPVGNRHAARHSSRCIAEYKVGARCARTCRTSSSWCWMGRGRRWPRCCSGCWRAARICIVISLTKRFGEATALMAGFQRACGRVIVTAPAYHQIQGAEIGKLVRALDKADLAIGRRWPRVGSRFEADAPQCFSSADRLGPASVSTTSAAARAP